jgi:hypothetical protein
VNGEGKPVVSFDIDGTLGDYHSNFTRFARLYFGYGDDAWTKPNPGLPMWEWMGISQRDYRDAKLAYRQGGWKRWMPCYSGAADVTRWARQAGAEVWLCTTRPYLRLDNVDPDTREWLRRNQIEYDALLFDPVHESHESDETKYHELVRQVGADRIASIVEDLPEMVQAAHTLRIPPGYNRGVILMDQPYNGSVSGIRRCRTMLEVWAEVRADLAVWGRRQNEQ